MNVGACRLLKLASESRTDILFDQLIFLRPEGGDDPIRHAVLFAITLAFLHILGNGFLDRVPEHSTSKDPVIVLVIGILTLASMHGRFVGRDFPIAISLLAPRKVATPADLLLSLERCEVTEPQAVVRLDRDLRGDRLADVLLGP